MIRADSLEDFVVRATGMMNSQSKIKFFCFCFQGTETEESYAFKVKLRVNWRGVSYANKFSGPKSYKDYKKKAVRERVKVFQDEILSD